jgi:hypothetical protein
MPDIEEILSRYKEATRMLTVERGRLADEKLDLEAKLERM